MNTFPRHFEDAILRVSGKYGWRLSRNTHFDTENRVLSWFEKNIEKRVDFTLMSPDVIKATFLINTYPRFFPKIFKWLGRQIFCPSIGKVDWKDYGDLDVHKLGNCEDMIEKYLQQAKSEK